MKKTIILGLFLLGVSGLNAYSAERSIATCMGRGKQPWRYKFPVKMMVKDVAELGVNEIYFYEQEGRGGPFLHPTKVKNARFAAYGGRDMLKELLEETKKYNIKVWLAWTPPGGVYPGTDILGLNNPELKNIYLGLIDEIAENYLPEYKNIEGIWWHEVDCSEVADDHKDDIEEFKMFCKKNFNELYPGTSMPEVDTKDKWWRRFFLYRNEVVNSFIKDMAERARKYNLKTFFCYYAPETYGRRAWKWGYDPLALEKICDNFWVSGYKVESSKPYQSFKGSVMDFGPSYRKEILPRNYAYALHGLALSYHNHLTPIYIDQMRAYYAPLKDFTEKYGDFYNGYMGYSENEISLFYGKKNLKNWLDLMASWQAGQSPANVSVAINPIPFLMVCEKNEYDKQVRAVMKALTFHLDIDGMVTGSLKMKENLRKNKLIIIPSNMATGLNKESYLLYLSYVKQGGKLLVINTPILVGREDLTNLKDKTEELCGISIKEKNRPGQFSMVSDINFLSLPEKSFKGQAGRIEPKGAKVLVRDKDTKAALLTRYKIGRGEVFFSALGFSEELADYFASIVKSATSPPVCLENSKGMRILEATRKENNLCISLWGKGNAVLKVDTNLTGLKGRMTTKGRAFQVKDIVTGKIIEDNISSRGLMKGIPVEIKYLNQPYILAIGTRQSLRQYQGIYPSEDVFKGMKKQRSIEDPEVPIMVPPGKGIKVGVYHRGHGADSIINILKKNNIRVFSLPRIDMHALDHCNVVIITQCTSHISFNQGIRDIRKYVEKGGAVLLLYDAVGYRGHKPPFPEIGKGTDNPKLDTVRVTKKHPITEGLETITHAYADHIAIERAVEGEVLVEDEKSNPVVVAGKLGIGKVVLNGMITGYASRKKGDLRGREKEPAGEELKILINTVKWLGTK